MERRLKKGIQKADKLFRSFKEKGESKVNQGQRVHVSRPVQQSTTATSALLPESLSQLNDCYKRCSASSVFLKRLIETARYELVSEAVTDIFKQATAMLESISRQQNADSAWMEQHQQRARTYLATLVKLSDRLGTGSESQETEYAAQMVDQLVDVLALISNRAETLMPPLQIQIQGLVINDLKEPRSILRRPPEIHNSMENLAEEKQTWQLY